MDDRALLERKAFEAWARSIGKTDRDLEKTGFSGNGKYMWQVEQQMFEAWLARAAAAIGEQK
jgi:hypothetical protein